MWIRILLSIILIFTGEFANARSRNIFITGNAPPKTIVGVSATATYNSGGATSGTITPTLAGGGSLIVIDMAYCCDSGCSTNCTSTPTVADASQTCVLATGTNPAVVHALPIFYCKNNTEKGNHTFTITFNATVYFSSAEAFEISNCSLSSPDEGVGNYHAASSSTNSTTTNGLVKGNDIVVQVNIGSPLIIGYNGTLIPGTGSQYLIPTDMINNLTMYAAYSGGPYGLSSAVAAFK